MPTVPETPARRVRFHDAEAEAAADGDSCENEVEVGDRVAMAQSFELKEDPSFWKENNVQVVIRIRPLSSSEISLQGQNMCVRQDSCQSITWTGHPESRFTFDHVAGEMISQEHLFKVAGVPMVENCVAGYNSCMFAYGQTGSGKTHTMLGDIEGGTRRHSVNAGMTPRVFEYMFSRIQKEREAKRDEKLRFICKCSFLEIYNEQILDLLDPSSNNLQIREDARKGIYVENLKEFEVSSARDVIQQLVQGAANRKVASTNMNRASSRSHSVFTCTIESKWESQGVTHHRFARLNLVDLAGSERQKSSGAEGERLKEATNINKSLSTLGLVIMNLVSISNKKPQHVPYRDSKLTFLLQDSLGGNSKTIIIANISPSNCCALETLSTLKFAQRAKFIRNNAIINEDASGDVIALRFQVQQLKKEVSRLRGLVNGGGCENQEADNMGIGIPESPGFFKWEGGQGSFSPLAYNKKLSQKKNDEALLAAAIRRDQDKDKVLKALTAEKEAAEQLASQRSDEVQGLKMRLRFREERIKRLEAVSSGKLSAEAYLLNEKEEFIKELEFLRNQVERNRDATRFAMENLQLKEELRRLQSFVEEGERDMMNEQITILQEKLLEALDWKLMHERDADRIQGPLDFSSTNEEMEFHRLQAIQNQREVDALRKNLSSCLEAKEKLERRVDELVVQLEDQMKTSKNMNELMLADSSSHPLVTFDDGPSDQFELKAMVEAIATASQREAEAHETAITLAKENEELRVKLRVLIEDNNKLIELCDSLASEGANCKKGDILPDRSTGLSGDIKEGHEMAPDVHDVEAKEVNKVKQQLIEMHEENEKLMGLYEQAMQEKNAKILSVQQSEHQLQELNEENEKLMGLYEQAMQERDAKTRDLTQMELQLQQLEHQLREAHEKNDKMMGMYEQAIRERDANARDLNKLQPQLLEMFQENKKLSDLYEEARRESELQEMRRENEKLMGLYEHILRERDECERMFHLTEQKNTGVEEEICPEKLVEMDECGPCHSVKESVSGEPKGLARLAKEHLNMIQLKLNMVQEKLVNATKTVTLFLSLGIETAEFQLLVDNLQATSQMVRSKEHEIASLRNSLLDMQTRRISVDKKFEALQTFLRGSTVHGLGELKLRSQARVDAISVLVKRKKEELSGIQVRKQESEAACMKAARLEAQLKEDLNSLRLKYQEAENPKRETEKVLSEIDNLDKTADALSHKKLLQFGKASELLKSELERKNLATEIRELREKLGALQREMSIAKKTIEALDAKILDLEAEVASGMILHEESKICLEKIMKKEMLAIELVRKEAVELLLDFQEAVFGWSLKEAEICMCVEELRSEEEELDALKASQESTIGKWAQLLKDYGHASNHSRCVCDTILVELEDVNRIVQEVKPLLS